MTIAAVAMKARVNRASGRGRRSPVPAANSGARTSGPNFVRPASALSAPRARWRRDHEDAADDEERDQPSLKLDPSEYIVNG